MPIAVAHGEGRAEFADAERDSTRWCASELLSLRFVDNDGRPAERYPANPNGSPRGLTGITTPDGRVTLLMPHPERVFRTRAEFLAPGRVGRGQSVDADLPQRAGVGGLTATSSCRRRLSPRRSRAAPAAPTA